jgi:hypothetical protein
MASAGQQYLRQAQEQAEDVLEDIGAQRSQLNLKRPGMIDEVLAQIQENRAKARQQQFENAMAQNAFGLDVQQQADLNTYRSAQLSQRQQSLNLQRQRLSAQERRWAKQAGFTPAQWLKLKQSSAKLAEEAHTPLKKRERQPDGSYKSITVKKPKTYDEALAQQLNNGVPRSMALQALNRVYRAGTERPFYKPDLKPLPLKQLRQIAWAINSAHNTKGVGGTIPSYDIKRMARAGLVKYILQYQV